MFNLEKCQALEGWFPPPHGLKEIREVYGQILVSEGRIVPAGWESANMVKIPAGAVPGWRKALYINKHVAPILIATLADCVGAGLLAPDPQSPGDLFGLKSLGAFAPRAKRSNPQAVSVHTWAAAIDMNADDNPAVRIVIPADIAKVVCTIPEGVIEIFESYGWTWGGRFHSYVDPMHFQFCSGY